MADLNKSSIRDAWHNEVFTEIRRRHIENNLKGVLCYNCLYNKNTKVEPLMPEYATFYDVNAFSLIDDINKRIRGKLIREQNAAGA